MSVVGVMNELLLCVNGDCENCTRKERQDCRKALMKDARSAIKMLEMALRLKTEGFDDLEKKNAALSEQVEVSYTQEELVKAVNNIIDCFVDGEDYDDHVESKILAIGKFMDVTHLHGHIAVDGIARRMKIELD